MPYVNLFTRMKSPTSSVGTIELDGILNGSTRNERSRNTIRITGKKLTEYSTHQGCFSPGVRLPRSHSASSAQTAPVTTSSSSRKRAKLMALASRVTPLQHREERFLRDLDRADLFHALLPFLLFFEQLALAGDVAAVAFRQHVLAQRLDVLPRDYMAADRRLDRDVEHLARDQAPQFRDQLAAPVLGGRAVHHARERVDLVAVHQDVQAHHVGGAVFLELVVE